MKPKFSIITPSFNQGKFIKDNIESVIMQNLPEIEHIVIDGASNDNTIEILKEYKHLIWISEPDKGPVDAIKKGIELSSGEIITWLNSDDYYPPDVLKHVQDTFALLKPQIVVGNMRFVNQDKEFIYESNHKSYYNLNYLIKENPDIITQPSTFFTKEIYDNSGGLNDKYRLVWDYELFLRMFESSEPYFIDKVLAYQRLYDNTISRNFARKQSIELYEVSKKYGAKLTDPIFWKLFKRFVFPDSVKSNPGFFIRNIRKIKQRF